MYANICRVSWAIMDMSRATLKWALVLPSMKTNHSMIRRSLYDTFRYKGGKVVASSIKSVSTYLFSLAEKINRR